MAASILLIYIGKNRVGGEKGKYIYWIGAFLLLLTIINTFTFRIAIFVIFGLAIANFIKERKEPQKISVKTSERKEGKGPEGETMVRKKPLFSHVLFGSQKTPEQIYEWNDINIHTGVSNAVIDLSNAVFPRGTAVVCIRGLVGDLQVLVPYEYEVSVHYSALFGSLSVFSHTEPNFFNESVQVQTAAFDQAEDKIKIVASMLAGKIEVKRK